MKKIIFGFIFVLSICCFFFTGCEEKSELPFYDIVVSYDEESHTLNGSMSVQVINQEEVPFTEVKFNTFGNAFRKDAKYFPVLTQYIAKAYPNGNSYGEMSVKEVKVGGKNAEFSIGGEDKNLLTVNLFEELFPNERVLIEMEFSLILANVHARTGYNDKTVNLGNFYPILAPYDNGFYECNYYAIGDPFYSERANYRVKVLANEEFTIATSGKLKESKKSNGITENEYELKNARDFSLVLSKEYEVLTAKSGDVEINYYYYLDENAKNNLDCIVDAIETFSFLFGKYHYETYSVCQTKFFEGGMEYPCLVYISDALEEESYQEVIVHETAHQWWYGMVGNNQIDYGYLDEGLAEYSVVLFYERNNEYGVKSEDLLNVCRQNYKVYCTVYDKLYGNVNTSMRSLKDYTSEYEYVNLSYIKPCIMFDRLRNDIGDKKFFLGIRTYFNTCLDNIATPDHLIYAFSKTGVDTEGFFNSFIEGKVIL